MIRHILSCTRRLLSYTDSARPHLVIGLLANAVNGFLATFFFAQLLGNAMTAMEERSVDALVLMLVSSLPVLVAVLITRSVGVYCTGVATAKAITNMRLRLMESMLQTTAEEQHRMHSGQRLSNFTNDIPAALSRLLTTLSIPLDALVTGLGGLIYICTIHWSIAAIALGMGLLCTVYSILFAKRLHAIAVQMQGWMAALEVRLKNLLDGTVVARLFGMRKLVSDDLHTASSDLMHTSISWALTSGWLGGANNFFGYFGDRLLVFAAGWLMLSGVLSLNELMVASQMAGGVVGVFGVSRMLVDTQSSLAGAERVFDSLDHATQELSGTITKGKEHAPAVAFHEVAFSYDRNIPVFSGLSFAVQQGELVAFVGPSGCGKSSMLRLVQGLYLPQSGTTEVLGVPVSAWDRPTLRERTALVPQEPTLFPGSIAENIAIGQESIDMEKVEKVCRDAFAHDFIMAMPDGYQTQVRERGLSLSGGERQRIAIARALYRDAQILLLDEATSAMDTESERHIHHLLASLKGKVTILCVTHRMAVLQLADQVIRIASSYAD